MHYKKLLLPLLLGFGFLVTGCGGDGGSDQGSVTPSLPSGAVEITDANATVVAGSVISDSESTNSALGVTTNVPPAGDAINTVVDLISKINMNIAPVVSAVTTTVPCASGDISISASGDASSGTQNMTFNACSEAGITFDGFVNVTYSFSNTGILSTYSNGKLTVSSSVESFTMELDFNQVLNTNDFSYTLSMKYSVYNTAIAYLAETTVPLSGDFSGISAGEIIVSGSNNTRLKLTYISSNTIEVYLDNGNGIFVYHSTI